MKEQEFYITAGEGTMINPLENKDLGINVIIEKMYEFIAMNKEIDSDQHQKQPKDLLNALLISNKLEMDEKEKEYILEQLKERTNKDI